MTTFVDHHDSVSSDAIDVDAIKRCQEVIDERVRTNHLQISLGTRHEILRNIAEDPAMSQAMRDAALSMIQEFVGP